MKLVLIIKNYNNCFEKDVFCLVNWDKEKVLSPHEEHTSDLQFLCSHALPLSAKETLCWARLIMKFKYDMCVLHTARISNVDIVMFLNRIGKTVCFKLAKEIERDVFSFSWARDMSIWGIKPYCCLLIIFKGLLYLGYR